MPIIVKDYTWSQTNSVVHIRVRLSPVAHEDVDLFSSDKYIKAHFSPYLFEVFLLHDVDIKNSRCIVNNDLIILDLVKREEIEWECLEKELTKAEKMKVRQEEIEKSQEEAKQASEDKRVKKSQLDRFAVNQAMEIDNQQHRLMDSRRDNARKEAMDALEEWRVNEEGTKVYKRQTYMPPLEQSGVQITELPPSDEGDKKDKLSEKEERAKENLEINIKEGLTITEKPANNDENNTKDDLQENKDKKVDSAKKTVCSENTKNNPIGKKPAKTPVKSEYIETKKEQAAKRVLPRLREPMHLEIKHTPRTFPTPSRESTADEEQAWLKNITMARRATGFVSEDLRPEEQDPQWCKDKGDEFFRGGNFLGAISAYTHGISLSDKLPSLFANRSATHFALGNFNKCIQDCSTALELMKPPCESNRRSRAKCIARRAAALARSGRLHKAIDEMKAAAKLLPNDEKIQKDIYDMERAWEQNPDSD